MASPKISSGRRESDEEALKRNEGNVAMSPVSVSTLLAILHQGAGGNTKAQLTHALQGEPKQTRDTYKKITHSLKSVSDEALLEFANGIFLNERNEVLPQFKEQLKEDFQSEVATIDFTENKKSAEQINKWASEHTHEKIKELVAPEILSKSTRMVLVNTIYFKGIWQKPFRPEFTRTESFYGASEKRVSMMHTCDRFKTDVIDDIYARWLEMPFQGERFSMIIVLPKERNVLTQITSEHISKILTDAKEKHAENVILSMPKFEVNISDLFSDYANLSGVSKEYIAISEAVQKVVIQVDERGATAGAATGFIAAVSALRPIPEVVFSANHPFLAFIVDNTKKVILFAGRISDPSLS